MNENPDARNVHAALATITEHWRPHRLTSVNDYDVKVVKLLGEFVWHTHPIRTSSSWSCRGS
ncbi:hypothetical protein [Microbacterium oxydans]|uniref:hypothetical protein n=1 Tax=Microbacterium oxydans TaxID=82380 RepID=UPI003AFF8EF0